MGAPPVRGVCEVAPPALRRAGRVDAPRRATGWEHGRPAAKEIGREIGEIGREMFFVIHGLRESFQKRHV